ncbi:hypothetical protein K438DRAFT_2112726 [Mycena galopus ATCC 62051]|nr:hypothetical protein K438DRAFT_2112726 [Mycena galopus ATCC 62051]
MYEREGAERNGNVIIQLAENTGFQSRGAGVSHVDIQSQTTNGQSIHQSTHIPSRRQEDQHRDSESISESDPVQVDTVEKSDAGRRGPDDVIQRPGKSSKSKSKIQSEMESAYRSSCIPTGRMRTAAAAVSILGQGADRVGMGVLAVFGCVARCPSAPIPHSVDPRFERPKLAGPGQPLNRRWRHRHGRTPTTRGGERQNPHLLHILRRSKFRASAVPILRATMVQVQVDHTAPPHPWRDGDGLRKARIEHMGEEHISVGTCKGERSAGDEGLQVELRRVRKEERSERAPRRAQVRAPKKRRAKKGTDLNRLAIHEVHTIQSQPDAEEVKQRKVPEHTHLRLPVCFSVLLMSVPRGGWKALGAGTSATGGGPVDRW